MKKDLNSIYKKTDAIEAKLLTPFLKIHSIFDYHTGYLKGTYEKLKNGKYIANYYPVSSIIVHNYGVILIDVDEIVINTKMKVTDLETFNIDKLDNYDFDMYSCHERNYIIYRSTDKGKVDFHSKINEIYDNDIMFEFKFDLASDENDIYDFFKFLKRNKFRYNY